jgi:DNA-binding MarR family transcriptional regulator
VKTGKAGEEGQSPIAGIDRLIHEPSRYVVMAYLYVVESADFLFLARQTGLTWGNLSSHLSKLEAADYVVIQKEFLDKKTHTMLRLTEQGRAAFLKYRQSIKQVLDSLPGQ